MFYMAFNDGITLKKIIIENAWIVDPDFGGI